VVRTFWLGSASTALHSPVSGRRHLNSLASDLIKQMAVPPDAFTGRTALITGGARGIGEGLRISCPALVPT
jgi:hypothetical protein